MLTVKKKIANLTPGTHLGGHKSSENWCHWTAGRLFTKNSLSDGNRDKLKGMKRTLHELKIWPVSCKREGCQKWWAVLRSNSKIMRKWRWGPQLLFILPRVHFLMRKNCWSFCWSMRKNMTLPERSQGIFKFYWFIFSNLLRLGNLQVPRKNVFKADFEYLKFRSILRSMLILA